MADLIDYGIIIIILAVMGYALKDAFYFYRKFSIPYEVKDQGDQLYGYISLALLILFVCLGLFAQVLKSNPDMAISFFTPFFQGLESITSGIGMSNTEVSSYFANILISFYLFNWFVVFFALAIGIAMILGLISIYLDTIAIEVQFIDSKQPPKVYKRIIVESDYFFYFEIIEDFRNWESVRKNEILTIKRIFTKSKFDKILLSAIPGIVNHPFWGNKKNRGYVLISLMGLIMIVTFLSNFIKNPLLMILFIMVFVPTFILVIVDSAISK
jgi:hypothetical protein